MNHQKYVRLRSLIRALNIELMRLEWECADDDEPDETDYSFDLDIECCQVDDHDMPNETDFTDDGVTAPIGPLCVECGNWWNACIC